MLSSRSITSHKLITILERTYQARLLVRDSWVTACIIGLLSLLIHYQITNINLLLIFGICLGYILSYAINDYYDAQNDKLDVHKASKNYFTNNNLSRGTAAVLLTLIIVSLISIFALFGIQGIFILILSLFVSWAYSAKPIHLKFRPGFDVLTHAIFIVSYPYLIIMVLLNLKWMIIDYILFSVFIMGSIIIQLENQLRDLDLDIDVGRNTTLVLGAKRTLRIIKILTTIISASIVFGFLFVDDILIFFPFILIYSPLLVQRLISKGEIRSENFIRMIILAEAVYASFFFLYLYLR